MDYKSPDNIYWLFSSSAQSIAAFIGFLTAGFYFVQDKIDEQTKAEPTLLEINKAIKKSHFDKLKVLCILTGASIVLSLVLVFTNRYDYCLKTMTIIVVSLLNIATITWAIYFIISIIHPDNIDKTAKRLIKQNKDLYDENAKDIKDSIKIGDYLEKFVALERIIRSYDERHNLSNYIGDKYKSFTPIYELFRILFQKELIDSKTLRDLNEVNKVRNLAAHGQIDRVDSRIVKILDNLMNKFENIY